jgi:hypothetical protein
MSSPLLFHHSLQQSSSCAPRQPRVYVSASWSEFCRKLTGARLQLHLQMLRGNFFQGSELAGIKLQGVYNCSNIRDVVSGRYSNLQFVETSILIWFMYKHRTCDALMAVSHQITVVKANFCGCYRSKCFLEHNHRSVLFERNTICGNACTMLFHCLVVKSHD